MSAVHVTWGPMREIANARDDRPTRWCFGCRRHLPHTWVMHDYDEPSYYEATVDIRCSACGKNRIHFPYCEPDGPTYPSEEVWERLMADPRRLIHIERKYPAITDAQEDRDA